MSEALTKSASSLQDRERQKKLDKHNAKVDEYLKELVSNIESENCSHAWVPFGFGPFYKELREWAIYDCAFEVYSQIISKDVKTQMASLSTLSGLMGQNFEYHIDESGRLPDVISCLKLYDLCLICHPSRGYTVLTNAAELERTGCIKFFDTQCARVKRTFWQKFKAFLYVKIKTSLL